MKRYLILFLGALFVLGITASAYAFHAPIPKETSPVVAPKGTDIRLGGEIRIRGFFQDNITDKDGKAALAGRPYKGSGTAWYDQRVRLLIDARVAPNVTGRVHLETDPDNYTWGIRTVGGGVTENPLTPVGTVGGDGGIKRGDRLSLLEAWIAYTGTGLLGVPAGIKAGHQLFLIGAGHFVNRTKFGDDAILLFIEPQKGTEINLLTAKLGEGASAAIGSDDIDLYSLMLTHQLDKDNTIGVNYSLVTVSDMDGSHFLFRMPGGAANYANADLKLRNLGLLARGKIGDFGYRASADFQGGKVKDITGLAVTDVKFSGYAFTAGLDRKVEPLGTVRASYAFASGDADATDNKNKAFQVLPMPNGINYTVVYDWRVVTAADSRNAGIQNTTAYNLGLTFSPMKDMTAHLDYFLLRASKALTAAPDTFGYSKNVGSELDLKIAYKVARNLTYSINSGILFAGDFYKAAATGVTSDPKNAVVFQHGLVLSF